MLIGREQTSIVAQKYSGDGERVEGEDAFDVAGKESSGLITWSCNTWTTRFENELQSARCTRGRVPCSLMPAGEASMCVWLARGLGKSPGLTRDGRDAGNRRRSGHCWENGFLPKPITEMREGLTDRITYQRNRTPCRKRSGLLERPRYMYARCPPIIRPNESTALVDLGPLLV